MSTTSGAGPAVWGDSKSQQRLPREVSVHCFTGSKLPGADSDSVVGGAVDSATSTVAVVDACSVVSTIPLSVACSEVDEPAQDASSTAAPHNPQKPGPSLQRDNVATLVSSPSRRTICHPLWTWTVLCQVGLVEDRFTERLGRRLQQPGKFAAVSSGPCRSKRRPIPVGVTSLSNLVPHARPECGPIP